MKKSKYARIGKKYPFYQCSNCCWEGTDAEKKLINTAPGIEEYSCPKCHNPEFFRK